MATTTEAWAGRSVLITGGAGYLASNLMELLRDVDCRVTRLDRPGAVFGPVRGHACVRDVTGDVRDAEVWNQVLADADVVCHFAAQTSARIAGEDPIADHAVNVMSILHLLEACRRADRRPLVLFAGTATECGLTNRVPVDEGEPDRPITVYDIHKLTAERYLAHYAAEGRIRSVTLRLANLYGPGPKSSSADRGVLNLMVRRALAGGTLTVYGKGENLRDYVYVTDVAEAFLAAGAHAAALDGGHFLIGTGEGHTVADAIRLVAARVRERTGADVPVEHVAPPGGLAPIETRDFVANTARFRTHTGWRARTPLATGIDRTIDHFLAEQDTDA